MDHECGYYTSDDGVCQYCWTTLPERQAVQTGLNPQDLFVQLSQKAEGQAVALEVG